MVSEYWSGGVAWSSGRKQDWGTPDWIVDHCTLEFGHNFVLDAAADAANTKVDGLYLDEGDDALTMDWGDHLEDVGLADGDIWVNPPYSRYTEKWLAKAAEVASHPAVSRVVMLLFARTDTKWWHEFVMPPKDGASRVWFIKGRLRFLDKYGVPSRDAGPAPSVLVEFDGGRREQRSTKVRSIVQPKLEAHSWVCTPDRIGSKCRGHKVVSKLHYPQCRYFPRRDR